VTFEADNADTAALDYTLENKEGGAQDMETSENNNESQICNNT
jgi:hypothetical protein